MDQMVRGIIKLKLQHLSLKSFIAMSRRDIKQRLWYSSNNYLHIGVTTVVNNELTIDSNCQMEF